MRHKDAKVLTGITAALAAACGIVLLESQRELHQVRLTRYDLSDLPGIPCSLRGRRILFFSDYHEAAGGRLNRNMEGLIRQEHPSVILSGGDLINGKYPAESIQPAADLMNRLERIAPVLSGIGNHERKVLDGVYPTGGLLRQLDKRLLFPVAYLRNESHMMGDLRITGLDLDLMYYQKKGKIPSLSIRELDKLLGKKQPGIFTILLAHDPTFFPTYAAWGADLILSGHLHGGIIRMPQIGGLLSPRYTLFPRYDYGRFRIDRGSSSSTMIVTNGLGQHTIPLRINNIPEVVSLSF